MSELYASACQERDERRKCDDRNSRGAAPTVTSPSLSLIVQYHIISRYPVSDQIFDQMKIDHDTPSPIK